MGVGHRAMSAQKLAELEQSLALGCRLALVLVLNVAAFCLGHWILGGSAILAETHEGEYFLRPLHGEEFRVSGAVGLYSFLHGASVFFTLPSIALCVVMLLYEWAKLQRYRRHLTAKDCGYEISSRITRP